MESATHTQPAVSLPRQTGARPIRVGLLGFGVVGREVARLLLATGEDLAHRVGTPLELAGIAARDLARAREFAHTSGLPVADELFTDNALALIEGGQLDVVIEVIGGIEPARTMLLNAMERGAAVITANKALLASDGPALYAAAEQAGVDLYYEAAVAGAIPLLRPLRESLVGDTVHRVMGIVNGTTNYILTRMDETGASYGDALAEAQALGYAEADPTADVAGHDAAAKAAILASLAYHTPVSISQVECEGIANITASDIALAKARDSVIKLLAIAELRPDAVAQPGSDPGIVVRVHPAMLPRKHPLAAVREAFNAVFVEAEAAGELMFYGRGAGGTPTASAVLGDLVAVARHRVLETRGPAHSAYARLPVRSAGQARTRFHVHLEVTDRPGVLAAIAATFAQHQVSLATVNQSAQQTDQRTASLVLVTHEAREADLVATVESLRRLDVVAQVVSVIHVEGE